MAPIAIRAGHPALGGRGGAAPYALRAGWLADHNLVYATWLRCYKHSSAFARRIGDAVFYHSHQRAIAAILARTSARLMIAHDPQAPEVIWGWMVYEPGVLHFIYVKKPFRRRGIARALLAPLDLDGFAFTHWTQDWDHILRLWPEAQYNPYLL